MGFGFKEIAAVAANPTVAIGTALAGGSDIVGGLMQSHADTQRMREQQTFDRDQAQIERAWEEKMSNSAVQRHAADLEKAGFNRILAADGAGASTPSVGAPSANVIPSKNILEGVSSSALEVLRMRKDFQEADSRIIKNQVDAAVSATNLPRRELISSGWEFLKKVFEGVNRRMKYDLENDPYLIKVMEPSK